MKKAIALSLMIISGLTLAACDQQEASIQSLNIIEESNTEAPVKEKEPEETSMVKMEKEEVMEKADTMEKKAPLASPTTTPFSFESYSDARFASLKGNTPVVINFHATWCPVCRSLDKKIESNLSQLPDGTVMLKADFDKELALRQELGITQQTTLVFFNASGVEISREYNPSIEKIAQLLSS